MKGFLMVNKIKKECIEDYSKTHEQVHTSKWKGLLDAIKQAGFDNMQVFVYDDLSVVHCSCENLNEALDELSKKEINTKWQELMGNYFAHSPKFDGDTKPVTKVFDLKEQLQGYLEP